MTMKQWEPALTKEECNNGELGVCYCGECESISWGELAELTHATQVARFNFCVCEDNEGQENPYEDCPKEESK
jgi:hypothetical protein